MTEAHDRRNLFELWLTAAEGVATDAQLDELNARLLSDADARQEVLGLARQQGWLAWNAAALKLPAAYAALSQGVERGRPSFVATAPQEFASRKPRGRRFAAPRVLSYATA